MTEIDFKTLDDQRAMTCGQRYIASFMLHYSFAVLKRPCAQVRSVVNSEGFSRFCRFAPRNPPVYRQGPSTTGALGIGLECARWFSSLEVSVVGGTVSLSRSRRRSTRRCFTAAASISSWRTASICRRHDLRGPRPTRGRCFRQRVRSGADRRRDRIAGQSDRGALRAAGNRELPRLTRPKPPPPQAGQRPAPGQPRVVDPALFRYVIHTSRIRNPFHGVVRLA